MMKANQNVGDDTPISDIARAALSIQLSRLIAESGGVILKMQGEEMSLEEAFVTITSQNVVQLAGVT